MKGEEGEGAAAALSEHEDDGGGGSDGKAENQPELRQGDDAPLSCSGAETEEAREGGGERREREKGETAEVDRGKRGGRWWGEEEGERHLLSLFCPR